MREDIEKAFEFIRENVGTLRLDKKDHIFVDTVIDKAKTLVTPEPTPKEELTESKKN